MLAILGALLLGAAAFVIAETRTLPARQRRELVKRAATYGARPFPGPQVRTAPRGRVLGRLITWIATFVLRLMPRTTRASLTLTLLRAGLANRISADELLAAKALFTIVGAVFGFAVGAAVGGGVLSIVFGLGLGAVFFVVPDLFVNARIRDRQERTRAALPDALDLLAVTVEAGLGFDGAVAKLTEFSEGPLAEEFALALNEIRIGEVRTDALKRMASRIDVPEVSAFIRAVVQADQLGMSIGQMLRIQAADVRARRQFAAEEKAMKMPIKMIFPLVLFILPATFIVVLGPFFINLDNYL
jgi:tight adherence protein C